MSIKMITSRRSGEAFKLLTKEALTRLLNEIEGLRQPAYKQPSIQKLNLEMSIEAKVHDEEKIKMELVASIIFQDFSPSHTLWWKYQPDILVQL